MPIPTLTWWLCDLVTGRKLTELPLTGDSVVCNLAQANQASWTLPLKDKRCPANWSDLLTGINRMIVLDIDGLPAQAWATDLPTPGGWTVPISATTIEVLADRANVPDLIDTLDDAEAAYQLCTLGTSWDGATTTTTLPSMASRFGFVVERTPTGTVTDYNFSSVTTQTVFAALTSMMQAGAIEFRFLVRYGDNTRTWYQKVIQIAKRIGAQRPNTLFDLDANDKGSIETYTRPQVTVGATLLIGSSSAGGSQPIFTDPQIADDLVVPLASGGPGYPLVEKRVSYDDLDSAADIDAALLAKTKAQLEHDRLGVQTWTFFLKPEANYRLGIDFDPGDTVAFNVRPNRQRDPIATQGWARLLGCTIDLATGKPTPTVWPDPDDN